MLLEILILLEVLPSWLHTDILWFLRRQIIRNSLILSSHLSISCTFRYHLMDHDISKFEFSGLTK